MPITRSKDVVDEINNFYPLPDGPGAFPLDQSTIDRIRRILKQVQRIPADLLPKNSDKRLCDEAIKVIRDAVRKAEENPSALLLLNGIPEHRWENPLSILRRMLACCPNLRPKEVRRRLLELAAENEKATGNPHFPDYQGLGSAIDGRLTLDEIRRQMKICRDDGYVQLTESGNWTMALTSSGWKALEEPVDGRAGPDQSIIFISCGQFTEEEKNLGKALAEIIDESTRFQGYFAQNQSSLEGLSKHIFGAVDTCAGFVAVMHHRGMVQTPQGRNIRASVWIEQEIAIAAFLAQAQGRELPVALYVQHGVSLEGVRQQLILNPITFSDSAEVVADFRDRVRMLFPISRAVPSSS
jgi:hypothetical protein